MKRQIDIELPVDRIFSGNLVCRGRLPLAIDPHVGSSRTSYAPKGCFGLDRRANTPESWTATQLNKPPHAGSVIATASIAGYRTEWHKPDVVLRAPVANGHAPGIATSVSPNAVTQNNSIIISPPLTGELFHAQRSDIGLRPGPNLSRQSCYGAGIPRRAR